MSSTVFDCMHVCFFYANLTTDQHWVDFISEFIQEKKFDPTLPDHWYQMTRDRFIAVKTVFSEVFKSQWL